TITEVLGNVAVKLADHGVTDPLIGPDQVAQPFGIEPSGQLGRADEVAEHHRELTTFGLRRSRLVTSVSTIRSTHRGCRHPWRSGVRLQQRSATIAKLASGVDFRAAARTDGGQECAAGATESRILSVLLAAPRTDHAGAPMARPAGRGNRSTAW